MLPKGWKQETLGGITSESAFGPRFSSDLYDVNGTVGTIRTTDLDEEGNINYSTIPYANLEAGFESHYLKQNDLLITRSGSCGIPCIFDEQDKPIVAGAFLIRFKLNEKVEPKFVHILLKSEKLQKAIQNISSGGVQKNLSGTNLKKVSFSLPPLPEQKKIAQILSTWDKAIATTEQLLANSQQQKKALMQQLLTGKKRLLDENGVRFKGKWDVYEIKDMGKVISGGTPDTNIAEYWDGDINWLTPTDVTSLTTRYVEKTYRTITSLGLKNSSANLLPSGSLLVCTRATIGAMAIASKEIATNQGFKNIIPNINFCVDFIYYLLNFNVNEMIRKSSGSTFLEISKSDFEKMQFRAPLLKEQKRIAETLSNTDGEIAAFQKKIAILKMEKKSLMQQLLTGKRRVKTENNND